MPLLTVLALMALPFLEIWLMILVGGRIGVPWTIAALFALSALGVLVLRRAGRRAAHEADALMRTGTAPRDGVLDPLMLMAGGVLLITPGFITAAAGLLLVLPLTRPALRWIFTGWAERRVARMQARMEAESAARGGRVPPQGRPPGGSGGQVIQGRFVDDPDEDPGGGGPARR